MEIGDRLPAAAFGNDDLFSMIDAAVDQDMISGPVFLWLSRTLTKPKKPRPRTAAVIAAIVNLHAGNQCRQR